MAFQVGPFQLAYQQVIVEQELGGGWELILRHEQERDRRRRRRRELEEESERITDATTREIARLLRKQEALDDERAELERLRAIAARFAPEQYGERFARAQAMAAAEGTAHVLALFERALEQAMEEEAAAVMFILNQDD